MKYQDWAPKDLVEYRKTALMQTKKYDFDPDKYITELRNKEPFCRMSEQGLERLKAELWRPMLFLPFDESERLIDSLLTNQNMRGVWAAIGKRSGDDDHSVKLWGKCSEFLLQWRGEPKLTPIEKRDTLMCVASHAEKLWEAMRQVREFDLYKTSSLIPDGDAERLIEWLQMSIPSYVKPEDDTSYAISCIDSALPSIDRILLDIHQKAIEYAKQDQIVKKPNAMNAEIVFFVRRLSDYFVKEYGQPLHDAVAGVACTVFDVDDIDGDRVRKNVNK